MQRWIQSSCSLALRQKNSVSGTGAGMGFSVLRLGHGRMPPGSPSLNVGLLYEGGPMMGNESPYATSQSLRTLCAALWPGAPVTSPPG